MSVTVGPDGFVATSADTDYAPQLALAEYLQERQREGNVALERALPRLRKTLPKQQLVKLIRAIHRRIAWIAEHERELSEPKRWQEWLAQLARNLYSPKLAFSADDLTALLQGHRQHRALWSFGPEELVVVFVDEHDLTPELAVELRQFQAELTGLPAGMKYQSQTAYQVALQHVHMLLWQDENDPLDPSRCWSEQVRADLRAMTSAQRGPWKALFRHIKGNAPAKPSKGWLVEAEQRLARVGHEAFRDHICSWFAPFAAGDPQPLTVAGSHVLRGLLWYSSLTDDREIATFALTLLDARWKAKRNVDKVMVALVQVLEMLPPEVAWPSLLRLQQEWPTTSVQIERLFKETAAKFGIPEEELKARALLKPRLEIGEQTARMMERLAEQRAAVRISGSAGRRQFEPL